MQILIIEDEPPNARHLINLIKKMDAGFQIEGPLVSISEAVEWLSNHPTPDLILLDIQLADGLSFEVFQEVPISTPVIFTTAYSQYAIKAFELNSLDYLLKPVQFEQLSKAMAKFNSLYQKPVLDADIAQKMLALLSGKKHKYKSRFLVRSGNKSVVVPTDQIVAFLKDDVTLLYTSEGKKFAVNHSLDELSSMLSPDHFFRISRQSIVNAFYIQSFQQENNQLQLKLHIPFPKQLWVSQRNIASFKRWLNES